MKSPSFILCFLVALASSSAASGQSLELSVTIAQNGTSGARSSAYSTYYDFWGNIDYARILSTSQYIHHDTMIVAMEQADSYGIWSNVLLAPDQDSGCFRGSLYVGVFIDLDSDPLVENTVNSAQLCIEEDEPEEPETDCGDGSASSSIWEISGDGRFPGKVVNPCGEGAAGDGETDIIINWNSPIVVNLNRGGFRFTDIDSGVEFDMDGNGYRVQMSWTDPDEGDSFLGLDRNGNGAIDDGQELFGNFTEQPVSEYPNGFLALGVFDAPENGGNDDGIISRQDSVFYDLLLWVDENQNGYSESYELIPLSESGIAEIELTYIVSGRRDEHGNLIPYKSSARLEHGGVIQTCDVFFMSYVEE